MHLTHALGSLKGRDLKYIPTDAKVVQWIAQTAINVELFTIPLYMTSLYSLTGMHAITGKGNDYYAGRQWPGLRASAAPKPYDRGKTGWGNKQAFNVIFSVFIQEMLHLQMAANLATAVSTVPGSTVPGSTKTAPPPSFTSTVLQDSRNGWTCYGPKKTVIPAIVDLKDTMHYTDVRVNVGPVDENQLRLFLAIELPQEQAEDDIVHNKEKYFPKVPFDHGDLNFDPATSGIMFGSIGYMYQCYRDYLLIEYSDGTTLWDHVFNPNGQQNDLFNNFSFPGHPMREFMGFETTIALTDKGIALSQALDMMNAITDQGEGATLQARLKFTRLMQNHSAVKDSYQPSVQALESDYPSFSDCGVQIPSADAEARAPNDKIDHYARFEEVLDLLRQGGIKTWNELDKPGTKKPGNWAAADLITDMKAYQYGVETYGLPTAKQVADSMNELYNQNSDANHLKLSQAVVGALKGITTVLDTYWTGTGSFPFPSMVGSGDRMAACWAISGCAPDLSVGIDAPDYTTLNHACQGLSLVGEDAGQGTNSCASVSVFHTCRGSNLCKGMGGCGFVQLSTGGGSCGSSGGGCGSSAVKAAAPVAGKGTQGGGCSAVRMRVQGGLCGGPTPPPSPPKPSGPTYTTPSDNICAGYGGCAVPISAAQVFPASGVMDVFQFQVAHGCGSASKKIGTLDFKVGDKVEDIAFQAYTMVVKDLNPTGELPKKPAPNALRLAFPPST
jgi:hypothetical protein